jgi:hypothetical protein
MKEEGVFVPELIKNAIQISIAFAAMREAERAD